MDLFTEYQIAKPARKSEIEATLIAEHKPLAIWNAKGYFQTLGADDAKQEATIALLQAIRTYTPGRARFSTYAIVVIRNHLWIVAHRWQRHKAESLDEMLAD